VTKQSELTEQTSQFTRIVKSANVEQLEAIGKLLTAVEAGNNEQAWQICADLSHVSVAEYKSMVGRR
jgi:hypothetical protein